eukprot:IDg16674t1
MLDKQSGPKQQSSRSKMTFVAARTSCRSLNLPVLLAGMCGTKSASTAVRRRFSTRPQSRRVSGNAVYPRRIRPAVTSRSLSPWCGSAMMGGRGAALAACIHCSDALYSAERFSFKCAHKPVSSGIHANFIAALRTGQYCPESVSIKSLPCRDRSLKQVMKLSCDCARTTSYLRSVPFALSRRTRDPNKALFGPSVSSGSIVPSRGFVPRGNNSASPPSGASLKVLNEGSMITAVRSAIDDLRCTPSKTELIISLG